LGLVAPFPLRLEGASEVGIACLGDITICGGISSPIKDGVLIGVGSDGFVPLAACAKVLVEVVLSPSAWHRIKPRVLSCVRRKRAGVI